MISKIIDRYRLISMVGGLYKLLVEVFPNKFQEVDPVPL